MSLALNLAVSTNFTQYMYHKARVRTGSHWNRYGPFYFLLASVPLTTADLVRHVLLDGGFELKGWEMYREDCWYTAGFAGLKCLSVVGWLFTIVFTYSGFVCMIIGLFWGLEIIAKIKAGYNRIRTLQQQRRQATSNGYDTVPEDSAL